ncbi:MAG: hypothetical protein EXQ86_01320 [Rhodospirillales bacterium]|nr:hypothetical protein [Rhodospirillales bacterium]
MTTTERPDKLSIIVFSGAFDRVHYALLTASAAIAIGIPVTLFFTMGACRALERPGEDGRPAWASMPLSEGMNARYGDGAALDAAFKSRAVATFEELLSACVALGVRFMICETGLKALGIGREGLRTDVPLQEGGVVTFLNDASRDGTVVFV